ncbi:MAG: hypothetical protein LUC30_03580 [Clostridiales bacterium]|nr:hypothetical protein [Clostridiales bacterium]
MTPPSSTSPGPTGPKAGRQWAPRTASLCESCYTKGLMTQVKHFAFNHQEINRAGTATFFNEQAGRENELRCYQYTFENNLTQSTMTAFNRVGVEYAGACEGLLIGVLRDEWGFEGSVVTDMVNGAMYMNWRDSFACGLSGTLGTNAYEATSLGASTSDANQALTATADSMESLWVGQAVGTLTEEQEAELSPLTYLEENQAELEGMHIYIRHGSFDITIPNLQSQRLADTAADLLGASQVDYQLMSTYQHADNRFYTEKNMQALESWLNDLW